MNENHRMCGSDEWRAVVRDAILPWALAEVDLGDDVLEVGPGYGATTDVIAEQVLKLTAVEIDGELARGLDERFSGNDAVRVVWGDGTALEFPDNRFSGAVSFSMLHHVEPDELQDRLFREVCRVLLPGGVFVVADSLPSSDLEAYHVGDTYNPIEPIEVANRLAAAGFGNVDVRTNDFGWTASACKPAPEGR